MTVRVGIGCFVRHPNSDSTFLIGRRKGSHGAGMMALPGGHLEVLLDFTTYVVITKSNRRWVSLGRLVLPVNYWFVYYNFTIKTMLLSIHRKKLTWLYRKSSILEQLMTLPLEEIQKNIILQYSWLQIYRHHHLIWLIWSPINARSGYGCRGMNWSHCVEKPQHPCLILFFTLLKMVGFCLNVINNGVSVWQCSPSTRQTYQVWILGLGLQYTSQKSQSQTHTRTTACAPDILCFFVDFVL